MKLKSDGYYYLETGDIIAKDQEVKDGSIWVATAKYTFADMYYGLPFDSVKHYPRRIKSNKKIIG